MLIRSPGQPRVIGPRRSQTRSRHRSFRHDQHSQSHDTGLDQSSPPNPSETFRQTVFTVKRATMTDCADKCFAARDGFDPLRLDDSDYFREEYDGRDHGGLDALAVWGARVCDSVVGGAPVYDAVFDEDFGAPSPVAQPETTTVTRAEFEQCACEDTWQKLLRIFADVTTAECDGHATAAAAYAYPEDGYFCGPSLLAAVGCDASPADDCYCDFYRRADGGDDDGRKAEDDDPPAERPRPDRDRGVVVATAAAEAHHTERPPSSSSRPPPPPPSGRPETSSAAAATTTTSNAAATVDREKPAERSPKDARDVAPAANEVREQSDSKTGGGRRSTTCGGAAAADDGENNMQYLYTFGEEYRGGIVYGHKNCVACLVPVPRHKGWISRAYVEERQQMVANKRTIGRPVSVTRGRDKPRRPTKSASTTFAAGRPQGASTTFAGRSHGASTTFAGRPQGAASTAIAGRPQNASAGDGDAVRRAAQPTNATAAATAATAAESVVAVKKTNGAYTIVMKAMTAHGRLNAAVDPIVVRMAAPKHGGPRPHSSASSFDVELVPPAAILALRPQKTRRDAQTAYNAEDYTPAEKKKAERKATTVAAK